MIPTESFLLIVTWRYNTLNVYANTRNKVLTVQFISGIHIYASLSFVLSMNNEQFLAHASVLSGMNLLGCRYAFTKKPPPLYVYTNVKKQTE